MTYGGQPNDDGSCPPVAGGWAPAADSEECPEGSQCEPPDYFPDTPESGPCGESFVFAFETTPCEPKLTDPPPPVEEFLRRHPGARWAPAAGAPAGGSPPLDFVWLYVDGPARGDELRFSIRSVLKNYRGEARVWVVGDKPPWYRGRRLPHDRVKGGARIDRAHKFAAVAACGEIGETFCAMQDDVYLMRPVSFGELDTLYTQGRGYGPGIDVEPGKSGSFQRQKVDTANALLAAGHAHVADGASHTPKIYRKGVVREGISRFGMLDTPRVCCLVFGALTGYARHVPAGRFRRVLRKGQLENGVPIDDRPVLNHPDRAWSPELRAALARRFPETSACETVEGARPGEPRRPFGMGDVTVCVTHHPAPARAARKVRAVGGDALPATAGPQFRGRLDPREQKSTGGIVPDAADAALRRRLPVHGPVAPRRPLSGVERRTRRRGGVRRPRRTARAPRPLGGQRRRPVTLVLGLLQNRRRALFSRAAGRVGPNRRGTLPPVRRHEIRRPVPAGAAARGPPRPRTAGERAQNLVSRRIPRRTVDVRVRPVVRSRPCPRTTAGVREKFVTRTTDGPRTGWRASACVTGKSDRTNAPCEPCTVVTGTGRCGSGFYTRALARVENMHTGEVDEYVESGAVRRINRDGLARDGAVDAVAARRALRALPRPWIFKDPRFVRTLDAPGWADAFAEFRPRLVWLQRDLTATQAAIDRAGWSKDARRLHAAAGRQYAKWPYAKKIVRFEDVVEAYAGLDPGRAERGRR